MTTPADRPAGATPDATPAAPPVPAGDRLIFALDVSTRDEALHWIDTLGPSVQFYKIGLELLTSGAYFSVLELLAARDDLPRHLRPRRCIRGPRRRQPARGRGLC